MSYNLKLIKVINGINLMKYLTKKNYFLMYLINNFTEDRRISKLKDFWHMLNLLYYINELI